MQKAKFRVVAFLVVRGQGLLASRAFTGRYRFEVEGSYAPARSSRCVGASSVAGSPATRV